jgi:hypothetical protein
MVLMCAPFHRRYQGFQFETWWLQTQGFRATVQQTWAILMHSANRARVLLIKLARLAKALKRWSRAQLASLRQQSMEASQTVLQLDQIQEARQLTTNEFEERQASKNKILGLAAVPENQTPATIQADVDQSSRLQHQAVPSMSQHEKKKELHSGPAPWPNNIHHARGQSRGTAPALL